MFVIIFLRVIDCCNLEMHSGALGRRNIDRETPAAPEDIIFWICKNPSDTKTNLKIHKAAQQYTFHRFKKFYHRIQHQPMDLK